VRQKVINYGQRESESLKAPMTEKHFSSQFENELHVVSAQLSELGCQVDAQICQAIVALSNFDAQGAQQVLAAEEEVNALEAEIDHEITNVIARRQPAARDLRLLMAMSKASSNLERVGNEADRMAHKVLTLIGGDARGALPFQELSVVARLTTGLLGKALEAFTQLDLTAAVAVIKENRLRSREVDALVRKLVNRMIEKPHMTSFCVELISLAKSLELVVDHARHIAELVIYVVQGADVRHTPVEQVESLVK
jgi:phosphate transport system protein